MGGWIDGVDRRMDGWMGRWMEAQMDEWMDG